MLDKKDYLLSFLIGALVAITIHLTGIVIPLEVFLILLALPLVWFTIVLLTTTLK